MENELTICPKCNRPIQDGELITGQTWNGEGGQHIECPSEKTAAANA